MILVGCAAQYSGRAEAIKKTSNPAITIQLDRPVHFSKPDGQALLVSAGRYQVEPIGETLLRLIPETDLPPLVVAADRTTHDIDISIPFALTFAEQEDSPHVLLLLPDGRALDAIGSLSGIHPRDIAGVKRHYQFQADAGAVRFGDGIAGSRPSVGESKVSSSYRTGLGGAGAVYNGAELSMIELQNVVSKRQIQVLLTQAMAAAQKEQFRLEYDVDRRGGGDYAQRAVPSAEACKTVCRSDGNCQAFSFVKAASGVANGQCFLKRTVPPFVADPCCISAKRKSADEEMKEFIGNIR
jgi:hypothetical protein